MSGDRRMPRGTGQAWDRSSCFSLCLACVESTQVPESFIFCFPFCKQATDQSGFMISLLLQSKYPSALVLTHT